MQNDAGEFVDLYVPRKCSASNRIIGAKDHASIQINIAEVDKTTGRFSGQYKTYAICGAIRRMGEADDSLLRLAKHDNIVAKSLGGVGGGSMTTERMRGGNCRSYHSAHQGVCCECEARGEQRCTRRKVSMWGGTP
ncbi:40S ribosomal protein S21-like [Scleropages formosus]|uniref:Small ribosomal subunit protein eS21 n=2 Tax=Scleropages formosus TaxID=113540 RepID=A0A0N8JZZ2_SCLFO|nr:40S ribosomal protein S21-like [Scleropages formosus]